MKNLVLVILVFIIFSGCQKPKVIAVCGSGSVAESDNDTVIPTSNRQVREAEVPTTQGVTQNCQTIINSTSTDEENQMIITPNNSGAIVVCKGNLTFGTVTGICPDQTEIDTTFKCPGVIEIDPCIEADGLHKIWFIYGDIIEAVEFDS